MICSKTLEQYQRGAITRFELVPCLLQGIGQGYFDDFKSCVTDELLQSIFEYVRTSPKTDEGWNRLSIIGSNLSPTAASIVKYEIRLGVETLREKYKL